MAGSLLLIATRKFCMSIFIWRWRVSIGDDHYDWGSAAGASKEPGLFLRVCPSSWCGGARL